MITLTTLFKIHKTFNTIVEIEKKIGQYVEYTVVSKKSVYIHGGRIMIEERVFEAKKDFFRNVRSIKKG